MADPFTLSASTLAMMSMAGSAASAGVAAYGAMQQGQAQSAMYNYQAGVAQMNAQIAKQNADYATAAGEVKAQEAGMKARFTRGETIAQQGAGGLAVGSGTNARVIQSELAVGQQDQALIRSNAARAAYGYEVQGAQDVAQSNIYGMSAANAKTAGEISAAGSLISGAGSVSSKWLKASQAGIFGPSGGGGQGGVYDDQGVEY